MVIDDDPSLLGFTAKYLTRLGYSVASYSSSEQAWKEFSAPAANYALVLIDLSLAGLSGVQLSQMMLSSNPAVRLILMSGYPFDAKALSEAGPDRMAFLHKPFTPSMLAETVDRMIGSANERC
jgi:two-component system, cell cycle sensor histidine kinase and response regulator CckA